MPRRSLPVETPFAGQPATTSTTSSFPEPTHAEHVRRRAGKRRKTTMTRQQEEQHWTPAPRQDIADWSQVQEAQRTCQIFSGNERYSCFPTEGTSFVQGQWVSFVWNSRRPELLQDNRVNLYLYRGDSMSQIWSEEGVRNDPSQAGVRRVQVDDAWWGDNGPNYSGVNTTLPFYFVITPSTQTPDGTQHTQSLFNAIQTTYPVSVLASMASASLASSSSLASVAATATGGSLSQSGVPPSATSTSGGTAGLSGGDGDSFPRWAIAVIVVLGFLAIAALCVLTFIILRRSRARQNSNRGSMGSASPMMANADNGGGHVGSPLLAAAAVSPISRHTREDSIDGNDRNRAASMHDGASTISRAHSTSEAPFSGADAAIMADAFRKALRKPDFAGRPVEEGDSPQETPPSPKEELINRELAEEGRDIRSVSSSRGVKVESPTATVEGSNR